MENQQTIAAAFQAFNGKRVLIIGDVMIDSYLYGSVNRISPEAPVPVVNVQRREKTLGGAANVALNVKALGAEPILVSVVGNDQEASTFKELMHTHSLADVGIIQSEERVTTIKHRILSGSQHMLRIDSEVDEPLSAAEEASLIQKVNTLLPSADVVIFEDYDKGVLSYKTIAAVIEAAQRLLIPTVVDPKKRNFLAYKGCSLFKPNLKELREGLGLTKVAANVKDMDDAAALLNEQMPIAQLLVTLSENGVYATDFSRSHLLPAHRREIADVSGAGDTVISIAALCLLVGLPLPTIAAIANLGGGLVCQYLGVVAINKNELLAEVQATRAKNEDD